MVWKEEKEVAYGGIAEWNGTEWETASMQSAKLGNLPKPQNGNASEREKG